MFPGVESAGRIIYNVGKREERVEKMVYEGKEIRLRDGRAALLRAPKTEDSRELVEYLKKAAGETEFLADYPEEIKHTEQSEGDFLRNNLASDDALMIVCTVGGVIAGNCQIVFMSSMKKRHRAELMIGLLEEYWGLGIGTAMLEELIAAARRRGVEQLELEMIEGNARAAALYHKMGFSEVAALPDAYRLKDGSRRAAVLMTRRLDEGL